MVRSMSGGVRRWAAVAQAFMLVGLLTTAGCSKKQDPAQVGTVQEGGEQGASTGNSDGSPAKAQQDPGTVPDDTPPTRDRLHQAFADATRQGDDPPEGCPRPPDKTMSDKSVYRVYSQVVKSWDRIRFTTADGKRVHYTATLETDHGPIEISLRPDLAPNHVRNFVALAEAGYYDQLCFDRIRHEKLEEDPGQELMSIEAGCPLGTGDPGQGSIGYWLKPEFAAAGDGVSHEAGAVGACLATDQPDTAGCRFYITLGNAPFLDGRFTIFGKVMQGLETARKIFMEPVIEDMQQEEGGSRRPEKPVMIKKVTIHRQVEEGK